MAEQQHSLGSGLASEAEVDLQVIAKIFRWMDAYVDLDLAAELGKFMRDGLRNAVHGGFVVAGRFDFNQLTDGRDNLIAALVEIGKTTLRFGAGMHRCLSGSRIQRTIPSWAEARA